MKIFSYFCAWAVLAVTIIPARADLVDFEAQATALAAPTGFNTTLNSPLVIGIATFTGGQLLKNESGGVETTGVYASGNVFGGAYTNPLTITFSSPVSGFSLLVTNESADTYTVKDNLGGSKSSSVAQNTNQTFSLAETGISSVTIGSAGNAGLFDFAIDNVAFTPGIAATPEPSAVLLLTAMSAGMFLVARRSGT